VWTKLGSDRAIWADDRNPGEAGLSASEPSVLLLANLATVPSGASKTGGAGPPETSPVTEETGVRRAGWSMAAYRTLCVAAPIT
jgi:hypothetical protein